MAPKQRNVIFAETQKTQNNTLDLHPRITDKIEKINL